MLTEIPATAIDIYRMLPEGTRCEVIFNELSMSPSPTSAHQLLLVDLSSQLFYFLKQNNAGKVITSPMDVYLENEISVVQPDILVIVKGREDIIHTDGIYGAPDIIVEILSVHNRLHDTQKKKALYQKAGVREYFIVNPEDKEVMLFTLNENGLYSIGNQSTGILKSAVLGFHLNF